MELDQIAARVRDIRARAAAGHYRDRAVASDVRFLIDTIDLISVVAARTSRQIAEFTEATGNER